MHYVESVAKGIPQHAISYKSIITLWIETTPEMKQHPRPAVFEINGLYICSSQ